jgi:hypothetical protein
VGETTSTHIAGTMVKIPKIHFLKLFLNIRVFPVKLSKNTVPENPEFGPLKVVLE